ncbi:MAG: RND family transporter [Leptospirillia bacterium]
MFARHFGAWVVKYRWWILLITPLLVMAMASGGRFLSFSTDYRMFFSEDNPQLVAFEQLQNRYTKNDSVLFAVAPRDGNVFTRETLAAVRDLTERSWQIPHSLRVDSVTNFQHTKAFEDDLVVADLVPDPATMTDADLERVKDIAMHEPLLLHRIVPESGAVTGVNVTIQLPGIDAVTEVPEVAHYAERMADEFRADYPDLNLYISGIVMMNHTFSQASQDDMATLTPVMYGIIILVMAALLRSVSGTLATVLVMVFSMMTAAGLFGWWGGSFTGPSASAPTIVVTLAVAHSIHILVTMFFEMRHGREKRAAISESIRVNLQPVFLTSLTTAIGFLTMNFSDVPPFHDMGNIVAVGVTGAFFYSILFLPALMSVLPVRVKAHRKGEVPRVHFMERFGDFVVARRIPLFWGMLVVIGLLTIGTSKLVFNDQFVEYFDDRYTFRTDTDFVTENLTGIYLMEFSLDSGEAGGIAEPDYLTHVEEFADWFRKQPETVHVIALPDTMKRLNKNMHGDDPAYYRIPHSRELAAQYLLLYELSLPYGLDLNNQIDIDKRATRFTVTLKDLSTSQTLALAERADDWMKANLPESMWGAAASPNIMFSHIAFRNAKSMVAGTALALVLISAILLVAVRSVRIGLISLVPNLVPVLMAFGLWGFTRGEIGLATSVVAAISIGIVVDDTVHFLTKFLRAQREHNMDSVAAVRYAFKSVGTALLVTSVILIAGFAILALSGFQFNSQMGILTALALAFALLADFLFLPPLLIRVGCCEEQVQADPKAAR